MRKTYLYIKRHKITGLKYFGKTISKNPYKYKGSGRYWLDHIKKHGDHIETLWVREFNNLEKLQRFALLFSKLNDISKSSVWANLMEENGIGGKEVLGIEPWNKGKKGYKQPRKSKPQEPQEPQEYQKALFYVDGKPVFYENGGVVGD
jgi:hypothetical protein